MPLAIGNILPSSAETELSRDKSANTIAADAPAPGIAR